MRVAELEGLDLDYWVFRAEHPETRWTRSDWESQSIPYSLSWQWGGPIIERERIMIVPAGYNGDPEHEWMAGDEECWTKFRQPRWRGPTPLVAAMRAFVSRKFGDEVEDLPNGTD